MKVIILGSDGTEMQTILPLDEFAAPAAAEGGDVQ